MAKKIIKAQMKQRQDTKANWAAANPVLLDGELGMVSDDRNLYKVGDGRTAWNDLPFRGFDGTLAQELGTSINAAISQKAVTEKLTELSADSVRAGTTEIFLKGYYEESSAYLQKGMVIESIGSATGVYLRRRSDGHEELVIASKIPYTLTFDVSAVIPISDAAGSKMVVKNLIDSKLDVLSSSFNKEIVDIEEKMAIASEGVSIPLADKYFITIELPVPLKAGMVIESISDALGVYLKNQRGEETYVIASNLPYVIQEDVYAIIPVSDATGDMIVKSVADSKIYVFSSEVEEKINAVKDDVRDLSAESVKADNTELPLGNAWEAVSASLTKGMVVESIGNAAQIILKKEDGTEDRISSASLPYTLPFNVVAIVPTSNATGSKVIVKNLIDSKLNALSSDFNEEIKDIEDRMAIAFEGVTIPIADKYYLPIELPIPLKAGMIIESISDATGVYLRNLQNEEILIRAEALPYTIKEDITAVIPISNATGDMIVKSAIDSKFEDIESRLSFPKSDLSNESHIIIPLPTSLARVNIYAERFPTSKFDEITGYIEFYDRSGNYFRKPIEALAWQGSTSLGAPKKNLKFDFSDCTMKVGNWVTQDSFHLKSNYFDVFRGKSNLAYDLWRKVIEFNRPQSFRTPYINASEYSWYDGVNEVGNDFNEARLTPAGFPVELYFNGEYQGIYTWNIKKDRANYAMDKKKSDNIHIDSLHIGGLLTGESLIWAEMEIRNPKSLITMDGGEYDGDNPAELIDSSSSAYDSSNADHKRSAEVKSHIVAFFNACAEVVSKKDKATFEKHFDKDWFIDLHIWGNAILDGDGLSRNTQYLYWGNKWYPTPYDCDQIYGNNWRGNIIYRKSKRVVDSYIYGKGLGIYDVFLTLYAADIEARYKELREADVISPNAIIAQISQYVDLIGKDAYAKEFELWRETPSYREPNDNPQWKFEGDYYEGNVSEWNDTSVYKVGDYVYVVIEGDRYYWRCLVANTGVRPYTDQYTNTPIVGGYFDSLIRTEKWLDIRFNFLDEYYNYL